jgi:hypothetical protein
LGLGGDDDMLASSVEDRIDKPSRWSTDGDLGKSPPAFVELGKELIDHRRLNAVMDPRSGRREEPELHVGPQNVTDRDQDGDAGRAAASLDARKVTMVDLRGLGESCLADPGVEAQPADFAADSPVELVGPSADVGSEARAFHAAQ